MRNVWRTCHSEFTPYKSYWMGLTALQNRLIYIITTVGYSSATHISFPPHSRHKECNSQAKKLRNIAIQFAVHFSLPECYRLQLERNLIDSVCILSPQITLTQICHTPTRNSTRIYQTEIRNSCGSHIAN